MSAWAKPGVKCVCVIEPDEGPRKNEVCTVTEVEVGPKTGMIYLYLAGYDGWIRVTETRRKRVGYGIHRFRPLITRTLEQDLEHFLPLLNTVEEPA